MEVQESFDSLSAVVRKCLLILQCKRKIYKVALNVPYVGTSDPFATLMELGVKLKWVILVGLSFWSFLKMFKGIALQNAPVSIRALIGKVKLTGTEKSEVRGFEDKTLMKEKDEGLGEAEKERVMCGLPCFLVLCHIRIIVG